MNRTTDDSRKLQVLYGGDTVTTEVGTIKMPPEQAKNAGKVLDNIIIGNFKEIKTENSKAEDVLSKAQIIKLEKIRNERKTPKAVERLKLAANQR